MEDLLSLDKKTMPKIISSKKAKISKYILFIAIFLFLLLSFSFLSKGNLAFNYHAQNLRKLDAVETILDIVCTIFSIFNYFFYFFFLLAFCYAPIFCCWASTVKESDVEECDVRLIGFFVNKFFYIVDIGFLITSGVNVFNDVQYGYSLSIFICASIYFIFSSIIYILISSNCENFCFRGICQFSYLMKMCSAPCCFFAPCKEKECVERVNKCECTEGPDGGGCCLICGISCICTCICSANIIMFYLGLIFYDLFWLLGKFFVLISCCHCWVKEDYDMNSFRFTHPLKNAQLVSKDPEEVKEAIDKIKNKGKNVFKKIGGTIKEKFKRDEEEE
jgi:hypothetical protein